MMHSQRTAKEATQQRVWHLVVLLSGTSPTITRAAALWELDRDDEAAMEYEAVWRDSRDIAALGPLSRLWSEAENFGALEQVLEEALELGYTIPALRLYGKLHADLGQVQEAESDFRAAAAADDDNAWAELGSLIGSTPTRRDEAEGLLKRGWTAGDCTAAWWLSRHHLAGEDWEEAAQWGWTAITSGEIGALVPFAEACIEMGERATGEAALLDAAGLGVQDSSTALAQYLAGQGRLEELEEHLADVRAEGEENWASLMALVTSKYGEPEAERLGSSLGD